MKWYQVGRFKPIPGNTYLIYEGLSKRIEYAFRDFFGESWSISFTDHNNVLYQKEIADCKKIVTHFAPIEPMDLGE